MSMTECHRKTLEKCAPDLLKDLEPEDVVPHLLADEVLTRDDVDELNIQNLTRKKRVAIILDILPKRGIGAYTSLLNSLSRTEGSVHLYTLLQTQEKMCRQAETDTLPVTQECIDSINAAKMQDPGIDIKPLVGVQLAGHALDGRQPCNPNKIFKDPDLLELAKGLGEHWETLALTLGLTKPLIYQCKENNKFNLQSQIFDMLYKWKCKNGKGATVSVMLDACKKIEMLDEDVYKCLYTM